MFGQVSRLHIGMFSFCKDLNLKKRLPPPRLFYRFRQISATLLSYTSTPTIFLLQIMKTTLRKQKHWRKKFKKTKKSQLFLIALVLKSNYGVATLFDFLKCFRLKQALNELLSIFYISPSLSPFLKISFHARNKYIFFPSGFSFTLHSRITEQQGKS